MTTRLLRAASLILALATSGAAQADWRIASSRQEASPNETVVHWTTVFEDADGGNRATLHLAVFEARSATLRVIDQPNVPREDLAAVITRTKAVAGVNGGYFDPEDAPVGLLVSDGRVVSHFSRAKLLSGVLFATKGKVDVVRATHFSINPGIRSAVQCGPLLLERAGPVAGLNDTRLARRTFAAVDGNGRAALGVSSAVSLAQLAKILCLTKLEGKTKFVRALNLDGGSSSAFWFAGKEDAFSVTEAKSVRDFVAVVPR